MSFLRNVVIPKNSEYFFDDFLSFLSSNICGMVFVQPVRRTKYEFYGEVFRLNYLYLLILSTISSQSKQNHETLCEEALKMICITLYKETNAVLYRQLGTTIESVCSAALFSSN